VLSAGILPAAVLAILAILFRSILRQEREGEATSPLQALLFALPVIPVLAAGSVALWLLFLWCLAWAVTLPLRLLGLVGASNRQLLYVSLSLGIVVILGYFAKDFLSRFPLTRWFSQYAKALHASLHLPTTVSNATAEGLPTSEKAKREKTPEEEVNEWFNLLPMLWLLGPALCVGSLFAIKAILYLWDPLLSEKLQSVMVIWTGVGLGIIYALPMSSIAWGQFFACEGRDMKNKGLAIAVTSLLLSGTFFVTLYSTKIYPELSQAWGGGKLATVTVWADRKDLPPVYELRRRLPGSSVTCEGDVVRIDSAFAFHVRNDRILLIGRGPGAVGGVALPTANLKMSAWGSGGRAEKPEGE